MTSKSLRLGSLPSNCSLEICLLHRRSGSEVRNWRPVLVGSGMTRFHSVLRGASKRALLYCRSQLLSLLPLLLSSFRDNPIVRRPTTTADLSVLGKRFSSMSVDVWNLPPCCKGTHVASSGLGCICCNPQAQSPSLHVANLPSLA